MPNLRCKHARPPPVPQHRSRFFPETPTPQMLTGRKAHALNKLNDRSVLDLYHQARRNGPHWWMFCLEEVVALYIAHG